MTSGIFLFYFLYRVAGEPHAQFLEYLSVDFAQHHCGVDLTSFQLGKLVECLSAVVVMDAQQ